MMHHLTDSVHMINDARQRPINPYNAARRCAVEMVASRICCSLMTASHLTTAELEAGMEPVRSSPKDGGRVEMIVIRPATGERVVLDACECSPAGALHGDRWAAESHSQGSDVTLMNSRAAALIAQDRGCWPLAGDQLYVDFDLSEDHLPPGTRISAGEVVFEITEKDHTGCSKFAARFGKDTLRFVNSPEGARLNLRGIYARVVTGGTVRVGDAVRKLGTMG